jgi:hypothetical protein
MLVVGDKEFWTTHFCRLPCHLNLLKPNPAGWTNSSNHRLRLGLPKLIAGWVYGIQPRMQGLGNIFFFSGIGVWTLGFTLVRQAFCHLSCSASPFLCTCVGYLKDRALRTIRPPWLALNHDPPSLCLLSIYDYRHEPLEPWEILCFFLLRIPLVPRNFLITRPSWWDFITVAWAWSRGLSCSGLHSKLVAFHII